MRARRCVAALAVATAAALLLAMGALPRGELIAPPRESAASCATGGEAPCIARGSERSDVRPHGGAEPLSVDDAAWRPSAAPSTQLETPQSVAAAVVAAGGELRRSRWPAARTPWNTSRALPAALVRKLQPKAVGALVRHARGDEVGRELLRGEQRHRDGRDRLCAADGWDVDLDALANRSIGILAITRGDTPRSLEGALASWRRAGLLDVVDEKLLWINAPTDEAFELGAEFGFTVVTPRSFAPLDDFAFISEAPRLSSRSSPPRHAAASGALLDSVAARGDGSGCRTRHFARGIKRGSFTLGPSLAVGLDVMQSDYVLLLEKDWQVAGHREARLVKLQLLNAVMTAERGARVVRLRAREDTGRAGFPDCCHGAYCYSSAADIWQRQGNWFSFYCDSATADARRQVADCHPEWLSRELATRCFTSEDSNWSNNPALLHRQWAMGDWDGDGAAEADGIASIGMWTDSQRDNGMLEVNSLNARWDHWKASICVSLDGIFVHSEVDG